MLYSSDCFLPQTDATTREFLPPKDSINLKREACCITNTNLGSPVLLYIAQFQPRFRNSFVTSPVVGYVEINWAGHVAGMGLMKNAYKISVGREGAEWNTKI